MPAKITAAAPQQKKKHGFLFEIKKNWVLYLMTVPGILFFLVFSYIPMGGLVMAFQNFNLVKGIFGSEFGGLNNFKFLFADGTRQTVLKVIGNTLYLNILFIFFSTLASVALAIIFNEVRNKHVKKVTQTLSILPYFVSWAVIALFLEGFLKADGGMLSTFLAQHGMNISFYSDPGPWRLILVIMRIWQGAGYGAIVYIATITGMDPGIYEAAEIDGASRWQQIIHLTLPMLKPTIVLMTLFSVGRIFYGDFGMIYGLVQDNSMLFSTTDVIDTYVYRMLRQLNNYGKCARLCVRLLCQQSGPPLRARFRHFLKRGVFLMTSTAQPVKIRKPLGDRILSVVCYIIAIVFAICCLIPFIMALSASFTSEVGLARNGFALYPTEFSAQAYKLLFRTSQIFQSYGVSLFVTIFGTFLSLVTSVLLAYPLSTGQLKYGSQINFFVYFTMLFSGGLVPSYMLISRYLHMKDSIWVLIIPILINPWNMFLLRNFFTSIPASMAESARIDGANDFTIMWKIILPCATPALATIGLFYALAYWNNWFQALMYIDKSALKPLQAIIMEMLRNTEFLKQMAGQIGISSLDLPTTTSKMATAMVTIGPIVLVYPFVQKYFTSGIMVGSVKG